MVDRWLSAPEEPRAMKKKLKSVSRRKFLKTAAGAAGAFALAPTIIPSSALG
ncbi:MAG: twin-arginine translocation signal domain-containing protein, partial [Planctomycetota bacterium]